MKNILISFFVITSFLCLPAVAEKKAKSEKKDTEIEGAETSGEVELDANETKDETTDNVVEEPKEQPIGHKRKKRGRRRGHRGSSSEDNRDDKQVVIAAQLVGWGPAVTTSTGAHLGYFVSNNSVILLEYTTGKDTGFFLLDEIKTSSIGLHLKQFASNSFYFKIGVDQRTVKYSESNFFSSTTGFSFNGESTAGSFAVGNQWQWANFTLGCDWFGAVVPFSSKTTDVVSSTSARVTTEKDHYTKDVSYEIGRLYLGASF